MLDTQDSDDSKISILDMMIEMKDELDEAKTSIKDGLRKTIEWYKEQLC